MRVLVAGCGDLGTRAARLLVAQGHRVTGLRRSGTLPDGIPVVHADLRDPASLATVPRDIDTLVFAAAPDARDEAAYRAVFVDGLRHVVAAIGTPLARVVFVSSTAVYGDHDGDWVDEDTPPAPARFNGAVLVEAERLVASLPARCVSLRLGGIYGPGREHLLRRVRDGDRSCTPGAWTNRIHVDDAARAIVHVLALPAPAPCYAVVDAMPALECEVVAWLAGQLGVDDATTPPAAGRPNPMRAGGNRRVSSARLVASGFAFAYPSFREGYAPLVAAMTPR